MVSVGLTNCMNKTIISPAGIYKTMTPKRGGGDKRLLHLVLADKGILIKPASSDN